MAFLFTFSILIFDFPFQPLIPNPSPLIPSAFCFPTPVRRRYLCAYKAPFCASLWPIRSLPTYQVGPCNQRNPRLIKDLRAYKALYNCRDTFTNVMSALQINLFMQNKANFQKVKLNVNRVLTKDYDQMDTWSIRKTKPIQSQLKPIKANSKPILTQNKANSNPIKPNFKGALAH